MSIVSDLTSKLPFPKKEENLEHFFALYIGAHIVKAAVWVIDRSNLKIINTASGKYTSSEDLLEVSDRLLDRVLGVMEVEPERILFGVPDAWLHEDDLKPEYLKILRSLVKALELKPMAYVASSHSLTHFLEHQEGAPTTAVLIGVEEESVAVTVVRAGKIDGTKIVKRGENIGEEIEKALLSFTEVEVLPSRILIYGTDDLSKLKSELISFPWMNRLSFLHFPKIDILESDIEVKATALAGATELSGDIKYTPSEKEPTKPTSPLHGAASLTKDPEIEETKPQKLEEQSNLKEVKDTGFITGDIAAINEDESELDQELEETATPEDSVLMRPEKSELISERMEEYTDAVTESLQTAKSRIPFLNKINFSGKGKLVVPAVLLILLILAYIFIPKATVLIYVQPQVLEKDAQVTADPNAKEVNEATKTIPGIVVDTEVSGSEKAQATGKKQVGDPAKGTVIIYNKTDSQKSLSKGAVLSSGNLKFALDSSVTIASQSATDTGITFGKSTGSVTAISIGPDSNLPSGTDFTIAGVSSTQISAKSEGNFSGGTSRDVTVVTDEDQKKLLASLMANLRKRAAEDIQNKLQGAPGAPRKVLEEALTESTVKKTYNKNVSDQANEFSLNLTMKYKGIAYSEDDLKSIVGKLVETNVPEGFELNLAGTETTADVSKVDKDKIIFLARFKAKLIPKIDTAKMKKQIIAKSPTQAASIIKGYENVEDADIKIKPSLPGPLLRLPLLEGNIKTEVSSK